ncbi:MAG: bifunctional pyr operon transcriptional regulator/uracil phosphoribosyltransferase PyrR [Desulfobacterales bacterium]|nr:bifunctional pyr operon transcriptional regulator/uracil phosphoribosyltransferase PyrR [Desulfobacterales bacterium]
MGKSQVLFEGSDIDRIITRMTYEILENTSDIDRIALIGIHTRGVFLARRIRSKLREIESIDIPTGDMDINLYRDDWTRISQQPIVRKTDISFYVDERAIILIDDVLFTGRTIRAAMDALMDFGRPLRIDLAVLIDRGHRELPIQANYIGKYIKTQPDEAINVRLSEYDGVDRVDMISNGT